MTAIVSVLLTLSFAVFAVMMARRLWRYAVTPAPLRIPTTPAPLTRFGAVVRLGREVFLFESLFRADKILWLFSMLFHWGLLLVLLRHVRYFLAVPPAPIVMLQPVGKLAAIAMMVGLVGLLVRRMVHPRVRYISRPTDVGILVFLLILGATGLAMTFWLTPDIVTLKQYVAGLWRLDWHLLPGDPVLAIHLVLFAVLLLIAPFSKLLHAAGIFFSPTRNQCDDSRERRHVAPWARPLDSRRA
ncbi:MAG: respiratory nitrate reductase subunit gamma [Rhodospirillales bacterium]|nr:respiratory nitrate reductase subunit gamma [Rhodospirillales bacterium]